MNINLTALENLREFCRRKRCRILPVGVRPVRSHRKLRRVGCTGLSIDAKKRSNTATDLLLKSWY